MVRLKAQHYPEVDPRPRTDNDLAAMFALAAHAGLDTAAWTGTLGIRN
ncbi:hypothetical protein [Nocardia sp. CY41]|nr:hypothetical protein [Nocardia sp. CY41]